jgi:hypothetical protein
MLGNRIPVGVDAGGNHRGLASSGSHAVRLQESIASYYKIGLLGNAAELSPATRTLKAAWRIRVAKKDGIIEVENQASSRLAEQQALPTLQELPLKNDRVGTV